MSIKYILLLAFAVHAINCDIRDTLNVPVDGLLNFIELADKHGHSAKSYYVTTKDGYILQLFHLPGIKNESVLFLHGVFDTSDGWVLRGNKSLGILTANEGYNTWFINFRGNRYSRNHTTMNPDKDEKFWDFSAHEYGTYDVPACIDFILNETGEKQLSIVAFSEGSTSTFVLGSTQLEYNKKVNAFVALAPVAFLEHVRPGLSIIIVISPFLDFFMPWFIQEIAGYYSMSKAFINMLCTQLPIGYELCYQGGFNSVSGIDMYGIEREFFPIIIGHFPGGTSRKNLIHFSQISLRKSFAMYDYGTVKNLQVYRSFTPPEYDLSKMTMNTVLISGKNDPVSTLEDVNKLKTVLPNVVDHKIVEESRFNHLDHVWGRDAHDLVYKYVLDTLNKLNKE